MEKEISRNYPKLLPRLARGLYPTKNLLTKACFIIDFMANEMFEPHKVWAINTLIKLFKANKITHNIVHGILNDPYINAEVTRLLSNVVQSDQVRSSSILLVNNLLAAERKHSNIISSYFSVLENPPLMQRSTDRQNFAGSVLGPRLNRTVRYQPVLGRGSLLLGIFVMH